MAASDTKHVVEPLADHVEHEVILVHVSLLGQSRLYARYASTVEMPSQQLHEEAHLPARGLAAFRRVDGDLTKVVVHVNHTWSIIWAPLS